MKKKILINGQEFSFEKIQLEGDDLVVTVEGETFKLARSGPFLSLEGGQTVRPRFVTDPLKGTHLHLGSHTLWVKEKTWETQTSLSSDSKYKSPMPGKVLKVLVQPGEKVKKGGALLILEAMKMEHILQAQDESVVKKIYCTEGEQVPAEALLLEME